VHSSSVPRAVRDRLAELAAAADLLSDPARVVVLAVESLKSACPTLLERLFRVSGSGNRACLVQWWREGIGADG
jgi:hypothetical protein